MEIRLLRDSDNRAAFRSGDPDLDRFLQKYAGQNQFRHHIGTTYVAVEGGEVLAYATVAPGHIEIDDLPAKLRRKLPAYPLPILRLGRLAVDAAVQGEGLGRELLRFVLKLAMRMADDFGCIGVVVDAKPGAGGVLSEPRVLGAGGHQGAIGGASDPDRHVPADEGHPGRYQREGAQLIAL